jgi:hypothetical protein
LNHPSPPPGLACCLTWSAAWPVQLPDLVCCRAWPVAWLGLLPDVARCLAWPVARPGLPPGLACCSAWREAWPGAAKGPPSISDGEQHEQSLFAEVTSASVLQQVRTQPGRSRVTCRHIWLLLHATSQCRKKPAHSCPHRASCLQLSELVHHSTLVSPSAWVGRLTSDGSPSSSRSPAG